MSLTHTSKSTKAAVEWLGILLRIVKLPGSELGPDTVSWLRYFDFLEATVETVYKELTSFINWPFYSSVLEPGYLSRYSVSLRARQSGDRIPLGARFSAPVQNGPGVQPTSYTMGNVSFPEVKRPGRSIDQPPPSSAEVKERVELYLYYISGPSWFVLGWTLPLPLQFNTT
jgi:hypothetical protein